MSRQVEAMEAINRECAEAGKPPFYSEDKIRRFYGYIGMAEMKLSGQSIASIKGIIKNRVDTAIVHDLVQYCEMTESQALLFIAHARKGHIRGVHVRRGLRFNIIIDDSKEKKQ